jgi:hypothetical protein
VHHNDMAAHFSKSYSEGSNGTDNIMLENDNEENGDVWSVWEKLNTDCKDGDGNTNDW